MPISENIKKIREIYNLSQKELAEIAGVTDKAVSTWEIGTKEPRMGAIQKMADYFKIKKSNIIEESGMLNINTQNDSINPNNAYLSEHEIRLITEYRRHPEMQIAIDAILGIKKEDEIAKNVERDKKIRSAV